jgi:hypothetical protein
MYKRRFSRYVTYRFRSEIFSIINKAFLEKNLLFKFSQNRNFWFYVFQLESIKVSQFNKLLFFETTLTISDELIVKFKNDRYKNNQKYFFNYFLNKFQLVLRDTLKKDFYFISSSILPLDSVLYSLFHDMRKKLCLLYSGSYIYSMNKLSFIFREIMFSDNSYLFSDLYNVSFSLSDKSFLKNLFLVDNSSKTRNSLRVFELFFPIELIKVRLRSFGFIHKFKNRPISNSKYLYLDDSEIIKIFGNIATSFLFWFSCVNNTSHIKHVVELLRQSCFLTLCRKHNKRKKWALDVYTPDLIINEKLFNYYLIFPKRSIILAFKRKFYMYHSQVYFNEIFFM